MGKSISGTVMYEIKATNPNSIANFDAGKLTKAIGDDLIAFVGKPMQGLVVKANDAKVIVEKVKKDLVSKKVGAARLCAGISGTDIIFLVTDLKGKYEQSCMLVPGYIPLREKLKKEAAMVVNLQKGDKTIDKAAQDMANVNKTKAVEGKDAKFAGITGTTPIILLAHGDEDKTASGQVYGKDFAGKTPQQLVALLCDNPDLKKRLSPDYSGTIYLDGCFTAQGSAMQNYTKQVWDLLKAKGIKKVSVKGNLGAAVTELSGDETITSTDAKKKAQLKLAEAGYDKWFEAIQAELTPIWQKKYMAKNDETGYFADPKVKELFAKAKAKRAEICKEIPDYEIPNLVGKFGLSRLN